MTRSLEAGAAGGSPGVKETKAAAAHRGRQAGSPGAQGVGDARLLSASGVLGAALAQPREREWKGPSMRP